LVRRLSCTRNHADPEGTSHVEPGPETVLGVDPMDDEPQLYSLTLPVAITALSEGIAASRQRH
jgi:hypothetical protein